LTKDAVARAVGRELVLHEPSLRAIEERFRQFGRPMTDNNRRQAYLPEGCVVLDNPHGTAPGFVARRADGKFVACMPGVPREMKPMLQEKLVPWLVRTYGLRDAIYTRTLHTVGIGESQLDQQVEDLFRTLENPKIAMLAHGGKVDVKVMAKASGRAQAEALIEPVAAELRRRIGSGYFGDDELTLPGAIVAELRRRGAWLVTAESCTGGQVADALVSVAGASAVYRGGIVAYDDALKVGQLGVPRETLDRFGAVSEETAAAMARGARERLGGDLAIATTGIAGPDGGTAEKPVGLVWFALAAASGEAQTRRLTFPGNRADIRDRATVAALGLIWRHLERDAHASTAVP
ncbi:MAG: nicotinamide-nucleotide amidase, partial [Candidatus Eremiobacteraeota bacterium]|nr:nicotinamide-nucleotide amidase [Candidatus Eremiobacteraeota bacterium]